MVVFFILHDNSILHCPLNVRIINVTSSSNFYSTFKLAIAIVLVYCVANFVAEMNVINYSATSTSLLFY